MTRLYFQPIQLSSIAYMDIFILIWVINCINCGQQLKVSLSIIIVNPLAAVKPKSNPIRGQPTWRNLPGATCPAKQWRDFVFNFFFSLFLLLHFHFAGNKRSRRALLRQRHATKLNFMNAALWVFMNRIHTKSSKGALTEMMTEIEPDNCNETCF